MIKSKYVILCLSSIFFTAGILIASQPKENITVAIVHNSGAVRYHNAIKPLVTKRGWKADKYDSAELSELIKNLDKYDMVIFGTLYNSTGRDFGEFAGAWRRFLQRGGSMVITDANYPKQIDWLAKVDKRLACGNNTPNFNPKIGMKWFNHNHPLTIGISKKSANGPGWSQIRSWSSYWKPLAKDTTDQTYLAYQEVYDGIVVISTSYTDNNWPTSVFLNNLLRWQYDPIRKKALKPLENKISIPSCNVAKIQSIPEIDGKIDRSKLKNMTEISGFMDYLKQEKKSYPATKCWVAHGDNDLYIVFECKKGKDELFDKQSAPLVPSRDEAVEVFINYSGKPDALGKYAVSLTGKKASNRFFRAATDIQSDRWVAEIQIPFSSLQNKNGVVDFRRCKFNFLRRYHPQKIRNAKTLCWAPALTSAEFNDFYGRLRLNVPRQSFPINPELTITQPVKLLHGENIFQVELKSHAKKSVKAVLAFEGDGLCEQVNKIITIKPNQRLKYDYPLSLGFSRNTQGHFVIRQEITEKILAGSKLLNLKPATDSLFTPELIMPAYRNIIQSKDPRKKIVIRGAIEKTPAGSFYLNTRICRKNKTDPVWQENKKYAPGDNFVVDLSVDSWAPGKYGIEVSLLSDSNKREVLSVKNFEIEILPPAKFEVSFDDRRICYVNGEPFFPIGIYHTSPGMVGWINGVTKRKKLNLPEITMEGVLKDVKEHGFNIAFHSFSMASEEYIQLADKQGLYVIPEIREVSANKFEKFVKLANKYDNVLMWYNMDEPPLPKAQYVLPGLYKVYSTIDPHRPTAAAIVSQECIKYFPGMFDILMLDRYPFTKHSNVKTFNQLGLSMDEGMAVGKGRKPIWMVPQAFAEDQNFLVKPTKEQIRAQGYMCIVHGATGLIWYGYFTGEPYTANPKGRNLWFIPDSDLWPFFKKFNAELSHITPFILKGNAQGMIKWNSNRIHSASWEYNGKTYVIAVNTSGRSQTVKIENIKAKSVDVMFEDRTLNPLKDVLHDKFKPYERHIYRY